MKFKIYRKLILLSVISLFSFANLIAQGDVENLALSATPATSYVSSWEDLNAINNGIDPSSSSDKSGGAYGNWSGSDGVWRWVEYSWDQLYEISSSEIYWWADGQGIVIPYNTYQEYYDVLKKEWKRLPDVVGNGVEADQYNVTTFSPVLTNKIRVNMISTIATGILEWKVWGVLGEQIPVNSIVELDVPLAKSGSSQMLITAKDADGSPIENYVFKLDIDIKDELAVTDESYSINGVDYTDGISGLELNPTNASGEVNVSLNMPAVMDPADGISISVMFNNGTSRLEDPFVLFEAGITPPVLTADSEDNNVDNDIALSFTDDEAWRNSILHIYSDNVVLQNGNDYEVQSGSIILKPSGGKTVLTTAGTHEITIHAAGYEDVIIDQLINAGAPDPVACKVESLLGLYRPTSTSIQLTCLDAFGNPVAGTSLDYVITVIDNDATTDEEYKVNNVTVSDNVSSQATTLSNSEGIILIPIYIPRSVNLNDGIEIVFYVDVDTPLDQGISYINDGSDKQIVLQNAVRNNAGFSWNRTAQSENFIVYWGQKIQGDPRDAVNGSLSFDPGNILQMMEELLSYFNDTIGFIENPDERNMAQYKHEIVMNETWDDAFTGWAFGGWADAKIGGMWIHPQATGGPATLAHEFTHMNQSMVMLQYPGYGLNTPYAGFFWESHANFIMKTYTDTYTGVQPERYVFTSMMHFSTTRRHYQNLYFIDYLVDKYGMQTVNDIWRKADPNRSHPLTSLRDSVLRYTQDDLNDDLAAYAMRNVTWDYSGGDKIKSALNSVAQIYVQRQYTVLDTISDEPGTYIVPEYMAPGDYGYNIIPLYLDAGSNSIDIDFEGLENQNAGGAGWRYGFVAVDNDGNPRYSDIYSGQTNTVSFSKETSDSEVYFVVLGAPQVHHNYEWEIGYARNYRYPYKLQISGAKPEGYKKGYNSQKDIYPGAPHSNGGGWVASTASVASTAWVGPNAQVLGTATVYDNARIEDYAIVTDNSVLRKNARVRDHAIVGGGSLVTDSAIVENNARVFSNSELYGGAVASGAALIYYSNLTGNAVAKDLARLYNCSISGSAIVGGDAEEYTKISSGTYLKLGMSTPGKIDAAANIEVNPYWLEYAYPKGDKPAVPVDLKEIGHSSNEVHLSWNNSQDHRELGSYYIYKNGSIIDVTSDTIIKISKLTAQTSYTFAVQAVDRSGNLSLISDAIQVETSPSSVNEELYEGCKVYPNPVYDALHLESSWPGVTEYIITDLTGRTVLSGNFTTSHVISGDEVRGKGMYNVTLKNEENIHTLKIIFSH